MSDFFKVVIQKREGSLSKKWHYFSRDITAKSYLTVVMWGKSVMRNDINYDEFKTTMIENCA